MKLQSNRSKRGLIIKYSVTTVVLALIAIGVAAARNLFSAETQKEAYRALCDAFTVAGIVGLFSGLLVAISNEGFFTGIRYLGRCVIGAFVPVAKLTVKTYREYRQKLKEREEKTSYGFLLIVGGAFFLTGMIFLVLFYVV